MAAVNCCPGMAWGGSRTQHLDRSFPPFSLFSGKISLTLQDPVQTELISPSSAVIAECVHTFVYTHTHPAMELQIYTQAAALSALHCNDCLHVCLASGTRNSFPSYCTSSTQHSARPQSSTTHLCWIHECIPECIPKCGFAYSVLSKCLTRCR